jgi:hypothetical protein
VLEKHPKSAELFTDVAVARNILDETFDLKTQGRRSIVIGLAYDALKEVEHQLDRAVLALRKRRWTERRVRSIIDLEAARVDHYEIEDLKRVQIKEARNELAKARTRAARMAALLAATDPDFHGDEVERMGAFARGEHLPGMVRGGTRG